jgi:tRNA/rRNA methyltransferase
MVKARVAAGKPRQRAKGAKRRPAEAERIRVAGPAVVLVKPQLGENIGFAARAMANFGLTDLRLVSPRDGWPNEKAHAAAAGAAFIVEKATVYGTVESAIGDLNFVLAATARPREMIKAVLGLESAAAELRRREREGERTGVLFGPERSGLDNDTVALADKILTAPVSPRFASLSLPQAVLVFGYEWLKGESPTPALGRTTAFDGPDSEGLAMSAMRPATRQELFALFEHLESELDRCGFLYPPEKRPAMVRAIRNMFHRMSATDQDVRTWRGIVAALSSRRAKRRDRVS